MASRVDLNEIKNIPEDEFKQNLFKWVEQQDISKELQSKLRSDLFTNFGKTALGRQIAAQYQQSQRMVLSSMVLVLNTLVAEFLYAQNCHFSLSVFSSEVPYKNVLPDFENSKKFRFDSAELDDIMKALVLDDSSNKAEILQMYNQPQERDGTLVDPSLLFCIVKTLSQTVPVNSRPQNDAKSQPQSQEVENSCHHCKNNPKTSKKDELHSKYYKQFYKYLELLSQHVIDISENTKKLQQPAKSDDQHSKSSLKMCQLNERLDKITESLTNLSKSNRKARKVTEMIKSITRLTNEVERCSRNVTKYSNEVNQQKNRDAAAGSTKSPTRNYTEWLSQITESDFGQRFVKNLEIAQEKAIAHEVQRIKEYFNEKYETTRKLIKFHYKQKTFEKFRETILRSPIMQSRREDFNELIDEKLRLLKERENYWKQNLMRASTQTTQTNDEMVLNPSVSTNTQNGVPVANTNQPMIPSNSPKAIPNTLPINKPKKSIPIELLNEPLRPVEPAIDNLVKDAKNRLQELEIESEQLDKSFHTYLKKQNEEKRFLADDIDNVWQQYERTKSSMINTFAVPEAYRRRKSVTTGVQCHESVSVPISTDEPIAVPRDINVTSELKNPYKILHSNLMTTGAFNLSTNERIREENANLAIPTIILQQKESTTAADKISQIPVPMKIKSRSNGTESKTHLRISTSNDNILSPPSDALPSPMILKTVASSDVAQSHQSDTSIKSRGSEIVINSPVSTPSVALGNGNKLTQRSSIEKVDAVERQRGTNERSATDTLTNAHTKDMSSMFGKMEMENMSKRSTSSESSVGRKISTGHKSTSSDEFWK